MIAFGHRVEADAALAPAFELYQSVEMTFWMPQVEATLAEVIGS